MPWSLPPAAAGSSVHWLGEVCSPGTLSCVSLCQLVADGDKQKHQRGTVIKEPQGSVCVLEGGLDPFFKISWQLADNQQISVQKLKDLRTNHKEHRFFPCRLRIARYIYNSVLISLGLDQHIYVKTLILLLLKTAQSSDPCSLSRKRNIWFSPSNSMFFLSLGSLHKSSEVRDIWQREHQNLLSHMISSHCSGHVLAPQSFTAIKLFLASWWEFMPLL